MMGKTYSISEINEIIKNLLAREECLQFVQVCGEVSNYKVYPSGHAYFTLKDSNSTLKAVCFKSSMMRGVRFKPENGMQIAALGRIDVYERDGLYQLYVERMLPAGQGDIMQMLAQIKAKLEEEGLFDSKYKKSLTLLPKAVGVITSPSGAAVHDIVKVAKSRYSGIKIYLVPVRVQGLESEQEIVKAIELLNRLDLVDVIILGRGGGSKEDLWVFNSEKITRRVFSSRIPIITAVGHESDYTLVDYAADIRAATPSQAAEIAVPNVGEVLNRISLLKNMCTKHILNKLYIEKKCLEGAQTAYVFRRPQVWIEKFNLRLDSAQKRVVQLQVDELKGCRLQFRELLTRINSANPLTILERGFAGLQSRGQKVASVKQLVEGDLIEIRLTDGKVMAEIVKIEQ